MKNNRHHSEDQALHQSLCPGTSGAGRGEKQFKQGSRCYNLKGKL